MPLSNKTIKTKDAVSCETLVNNQKAEMLTEKSLLTFRGVKLANFLVDKLKII